MNVDVSIITALPLEREAILNSLKATKCTEFEYHGSKGRDYQIFDLPVSGETRLRVAVGQITRVGPINAAAGTSNMLEDISPTLSVVVGISGCMLPPGDKAILGDIGVAEFVTDCTLVKREEGREVPNWHVHRCETAFMSPITQWIQNFQLDPAITRDCPDKHVRPPKAFVGPYVSGSFVLADEQVKRELHQKVNTAKLIGIEMESAGVFAVLEQHPENNSFLLIKAFCDWAGSDKSTANASRKDWQPYAARAAAEFTVRVLQECIGNKIPRYRVVPNPSSRLDRQVKIAVDCFVEGMPDAPPFVGETIKSLFQSASDQANRLKVATTQSTGMPRGKPDVFEALIGQSHQFLIYANAIFGHAEEVFAVSLDSVSRFWANEEMKEDVKAYVRLQSSGKSDKVTRLFVFERPEEVHRYARRLDFHAELYSNTFVCSLEHYEVLLRNEIASTNAHVEHLLNQDFALLKYSQNSNYFAELSEGRVALQHISSEVVQSGVHVSRTRRLFESIIKGCANEELVNNIRNVPILRWRPNLSDQDVWATVLGKLFRERTADALHLVCLPSLPDELRLELVNLKNDIAFGGTNRGSLAIRHNCKVIRTLTKIHADEPVKDALTRGKLRFCGSEIPQFCVIALFQEASDLNNYLADTEHSRIRLKAILSISQQFPRAMELLEKHDLNSVEDFAKLGIEAAVVFQQLEEVCGILRIEYRDDEMLEFFVQTSPPSF